MNDFLEALMIVVPPGLAGTLLFFVPAWGPTLVFWRPVWDNTTPPRSKIPFYSLPDLAVLAAHLCFAYALFGACRYALPDDAIIFLSGGISLLVVIAWGGRSAVHAAVQDIRVAFPVALAGGALPHVRDRRQRSCDRLRIAVLFIRCSRT